MTLVLNTTDTATILGFYWRGEITRRAAVAALYLAGRSPNATRELMGLVDDLMAVRDRDKQ